MMEGEYYEDDVHSVELDSKVHVVPVELPHNRAHGSGQDDGDDNVDDSGVDPHVQG